jgi:hypothetical protein
LKPEDVQAAIAFAVASAQEDLPVPAATHIRLRMKLGEDLALSLKANSKSPEHCSGLSKY